MKNNMNSLTIYEQGQKVAHLKSDQGGIVRLIFPKSIEEEARNKILDVFAEIKSSDKRHPLKEIAEGYMQQGFEVRKTEKDKNTEDIEQREATLEQKKEAKFIYESNLIEEVIEISYDEILRLVMSNEFGGHVSAWKFAKQLAKDNTPLKGEHICQMQGFISDEQSKFPKHHLADEFRGKLRNVHVGIAGRIVDIPTQEDFDSFFERLNEQLGQLDSEDLEGILRFAAQNHLEYEAMHPFADGNGRTGRLIINFILAYFGYDPLIITSHDKGKYYFGFKGGDFEDSKDMEEYFINQYKILFK